MPLPEAEGAAGRCRAAATVLALLEAQPGRHVHDVRRRQSLRHRGPFEAAYEHQKRLRNEQKQGGRGKKNGGKQEKYNNIRINFFKGKAMKQQN